MGPRRQVESRWLDQLAAGAELVLAATAPKIKMDTAPSQKSAEYHHQNAQSGPPALGSRSVDSVQMAALDWPLPAGCAARRDFARKSHCR